MTKKNTHVVPHGGEWAIKIEGNKKVTSTHSIQKEAIKRATEISKKNKGELFIHSRKGKYGNVIVMEVTLFRLKANFL